MNRESPILRMSSIGKSFPGVRALDEVSFDARRGEIVALVGVNGAGKSTLMNILAGVLRPSEGEVFVDGRRVVFHSPKDASKCGISLIHQELLFFSSQSVAENIFISRLFVSRALPFLVNRNSANREARRYLGMLQSDISPTARMSDLSVGERQIVEIARALADGSNILIFDEPTSSLSFIEKETLFKVIRKLRDEGNAIIYISHFLDEISELCERFVVLKNGQVHGHGYIKDVTKDDIIKMIVGKELSAQAKSIRQIKPDPVLKVEKLNQGKRLRDISFVLNRGEILGLWGLMGSGRTEVIRAILGLDSIDSGSVYLAGNGELTKMSPRTLLRHCAYVTESRHADGLFLTEPIWKNITVTALHRYASRILRFLRTGEEVSTAKEHMISLGIRAPGPQALVRSLSGGNQQKVVFAKWLNLRPRILILDEPTRGVDVGAKVEISKLIKQLASEGISTVLVSSEVEEMVSLSDRVLILRNGQIVSTVEGPHIDNGVLMARALGGNCQ